MTRDMQSIIEELAIEEWLDEGLYTPSYNIAPTQRTPILIDDGIRYVQPMRWGLIPYWAKDMKIGSRMINARSETLLEKPSFRNLVPKQRCVVIVDGYFEWHREGSTKTPYYIKHPENKLLPMAGLWDTWKSSDGVVINSYTVITTEPQPEITFIHNRMPVILKSNVLDTWLKPKTYETAEAMNILKPYDGELEYYTVSNEVNYPTNNKPGIINPLS